MDTSRTLPGVLDRGERRSLRVGIRPRDARVGVGHRRRDEDVGESGREGPVVPIGRAAVEDFHDHLDVRGVEEPEVARVRGEIDGVTMARRAVGGAPLRRHAEAAAVRHRVAPSAAHADVSAREVDDVAVDVVKPVLRPGDPDGAIERGGQPGGPHTRRCVRGKTVTAPVVAARRNVAIGPARGFPSVPRRSSWRRPEWETP